jgi:hypothetical protein
MREEWDQLASAAAAMWPNSKLSSPEVVSTWWVLLEDLEGGHVAMALADLAKTSEFLPSVAEIRQQAAVHEARTAPQQLPAWRTNGDGAITFATWRARGYPGLPDTITRERCEEIARTWLGIKDAGA